jgi:timeless
MRNQESPETDQDVIDWIVENIKDRNRTRRGVIKKLKELGLIFKAPTKKSNAAAANKNLFTKDEDEKLQELYDEHRLDKHCLAKIMEVFKGKRSKKLVVKRMLQLHLIADETEILPPKKESRKKNYEDGSSERHSESDERSESDESDDDDNNSRIGMSSRQSMSVSRSNYQISQRDVTNYRIELEESLKEAIDWIIESLKEAAEDFEEVSDEISDAIPIVPFSESQKQALENPQFQGLLRSINLIEPHDTETYWKIPANMLPNDLQKRAQLLAGEIPTISQHDTAKNSESENDNDDDSDLFSRLRAQHNALVYNHSDNEDDRPKSSVVSKKTKKSQQQQQKVAKLNTKLIKKLYPQLSVEHGSTMQWLVELLDEKITNKATKSTLIDEMLIVPSTNDQKESLKDENLQKLLTALSLIPPNGIESHWQIPESLTVKELKKRMELLKVKNTQNDVDATDESDSEQMIIKRKKPKATREQSQNNDEDDFGINTQQLKERLAELESSSDDNNDDATDMSQSTKQQNKKIINRHILDSSDDDDNDDHGGTDDAEMTKQIIKPNEIKQQKRKSEKRERSQSPDENEMNASNNNQMKKIRRIIDSDDDE